jgi:hypothetical protein
MSVNAKIVEKISREVMASDAKAETGRTSYLRALLIDVQAAVGEKGRDKVAQLAALKLTHEAFYEIVMEVAESFVPKHTKDRATILQQRANFARTAASALRGFLSAGHDVMTLKADTVTKRFLRGKAIPAVPRRRSVRALRGLAEKRSKVFVATVIELADSDREAAQAELRILIDQLQQQLIGLETAPAKRGRAAKLHGDTQIIGGNVFRASDTTVARAELRAH